MKGGAHNDDNNDDPSAIAFLDCGYFNFNHAEAVELRRCNLPNHRWYFRLNPLGQKFILPKRSMFSRRMFISHEELGSVQEFVDIGVRSECFR